MTCKDCKHWSGYTEEWRDAMGICLREKIAYYASSYGVILGPFEKDALFETGKNFGCIHWEAKE
jgi:hypothetical protein